MRRGQASGAESGGSPRADMRRTGSASTRDEPQIVRRAGPSAVHHYRAGLRSAARGASLPYGYTVTMWCSGQVLIHFHGTPGLGLVALFAGGALTGFGAVRTEATRRHAHRRRVARGPGSAPPLTPAGPSSHTS